MRTALITGVTGQDGAYLTQNLVRRGYNVYATYRRSSSENFWRLKALGVFGDPQLILVQHDVTDFGSTLRLLDQAAPDEIYNLAAQSYVQASFDQPFTTAHITGLGPLTFLEALRVQKARARYYQASSAEMYGLVQSVPQDEQTPFYPRSPYGVSKLFAHWMTVNYRESYGMFAACGILFNHESPLRGKEFVTRKITHAVAKIARGSEDILRLGNLNAVRDWGYASDYAEGMRLILQAEKPDTFVLATGKTTSVRDFVTLAFAQADIDLAWSGSGVEEFAVSQATGKRLVEIDSFFFRPAEVDALVGNPSKARETLGWQPITDLQELCRLMVEADLRQIGSESAS